MSQRRTAKWKTFGSSKLVQVNSIRFRLFFKYCVICKTAQSTHQVEFQVKLLARDADPAVLSFSILDSLLEVFEVRE